MAFRPLFALFLLCAVAAPGRAAEPRWSRVDTPNFVVIGTGSEKHLQTVGAQFEGFREALTRLVSPTATSTAVPTIVIAFPDDKSFKPFKPVYEGKTVDVGGLFVPRRDVNYILIGPAISPDSLRGVFHEYSHLIISNVAPTIPVWLNEGLAEYYSSFELGTDGHRVVIGRPILRHLRTLNDEPLIPLQDLLATTHESPQYNEGSPRSTFYAESWALVHLMLHGEPDRRAAFSAYANEFATATPPDVAWARHFGKDDLLAAVRLYAGRRVLMARQFTLSEKIARTPGTTVPLTPAAAEAAFGRLLMDLRRPEAAAERFDRALALDAAYTLAAIGGARARNLAVPAVGIGDEDWLTSYLIGVDLLEQRSRDKPTLAAAAAALERAIAKHPDLPNAQVRYGEAMELAEVDAARAVEALKKAHAAVPVRDDYTFALARALVRAGDAPAARSVLGEVMARPHLPGAREQAVEMMRQVLRAEERTRAAAGHAAAPGPPAPAGADDVGAGGSADGRAGEGAAGRSLEHPVFRETAAGETRSEGLLERIDCTAARITLSVRLADRVAKFQAPRLDGIEFITYRPDLRGGVVCGARTPPDPVYVTWRSGDLDGTVVAIEFLPKKP